MRSLLMRTSGALMFIVISFGALGEEGKPDSSGDTSGLAARPVLTGKERLGPKWQDEQRIDNCHVPIDKRGNKPRPSNCPHDPSS